MEWIKDYWYIIIPGLAAVMFLFGYRTKNMDMRHEIHDDEKAPGKRHGCCH